MTELEVLAQKAIRTLRRLHSVLYERERLELAQLEAALEMDNCPECGHRPHGMEGCEVGIGAGYRGGSEVWEELELCECKYTDTRSIP